MGAIIVLILSLAAIVGGGYFVVKKWKKEELEQRQKRARLAVANRTTSMTDLIQKIDGRKPATQQPPKQEEPPEEAPKPPVKKSHEKSEAHLASLRQALASASAAVNKVSATKSRWSAADSDNDSRCSTVGDAVVYLGNTTSGELVDVATKAVDTLIDRQDSLVSCQKKMRTEARQLELDLQDLEDATSALRVEVLKAEKVDRTSTTPSLATTRLLARDILDRLEEELRSKEGYRAQAKAIQRKTRRVKYFKPLSAEHTDSQEALVAELFEILHGVFAKWKSADEAENAYNTAKFRYDSLGQDLESLQRRKVDCDPSALGSHLAEVREKELERLKHLDSLPILARRMSPVIAEFSKSLTGLEAQLATMQVAARPSRKLHAYINVTRELIAGLRKKEVSLKENEQANIKTERRKRQASSTERLAQERPRLRERLLNAFAIQRQLTEGKERLDIVLAAWRKCASTQVVISATSRNQPSTEELTRRLADVGTFSERAARLRRELATLKARVIDVRDPLLSLAGRMASEADDILKVITSLKPPADEDLCLADEAELKSLSSQVQRLKALAEEWRKTLADSQVVGQSDQSEGVDHILAIRDNFARALATFATVRDLESGYDGLAESELLEAAALNKHWEKQAAAPPEKPTDADVQKFLEDVDEWAKIERDLHVSAWQARERLAAHIADLDAEKTLLGSALAEMRKAAEPVGQTLSIEDRLGIEILEWLNYYVDCLSSSWHKRLLNSSTSDPGDDSKNAEPAHLEEVRELRRSHGFALAQARVAKAKHDRDLAVPTPPMPQEPGLPDVRKESPFDELLAAMQKFLDDKEDCNSRRLELKATIDKSREAFERRKKTVQGKAAAIKEATDRIDEETKANRTQDWLTALAAAKKQASIV